MPPKACLTKSKSFTDDKRQKTVFILINSTKEMFEKVKPFSKDTEKS